MGSSVAHPRESDEWKGMDMRQKFEFFAPIWRVMVRRDEKPADVREADPEKGTLSWNLHAVPHAACPAA